MRRQLKGYGFYIIILGIILAALLLQDSLSNTGSQNYEYNNFLADMENNTIEKVDVYQNQEPPTGKVTVTFNDGRKEQFNTPDVKAIANLLVTSNNLQDKYTMHDISKPNWFLTNLLPYLLGFVVIIFLFSFLSNQAAGGGGGNSKVMNFGKSRAKMTTDENKKTTFKNVARFRRRKRRVKRNSRFLKDSEEICACWCQDTKRCIIRGTSWNR